MLNSNTFILKSEKDGIDIGWNTTTKVNCNVGINHISQIEIERERLNSIYQNDIKPDMFMDLSIIQLENPLYNKIIKLFQCPVGTVPTYAFPFKQKITTESALNILKKQADDGISFFTLHLTANLELLDIASKTRLIPVTSRGGSILLYNIKSFNQENIWMQLLPKIINIAKQYNIAISLGSTFRPAGINDACDMVHLLETNKQLILCDFLQKEGVKVIIENVGHIDIAKIKRHANLLQKFNAPIMPLGPSPTDCATNLDHIAAAIGASHMGLYNCAHIINCITAAEHSKSSFSILETLEAIKVAKLTAHIIDISKGLCTQEDNDIYRKRASMLSCVEANSESCDRCSYYCPLKLIKK